MCVCVCVCVCVCGCVQIERRKEYTDITKTWPQMELNCNVIWIFVNPVHDEILDCVYSVKVSCRPYHKSGVYNAV